MIMAVGRNFLLPHAQTEQGDTMTATRYILSSNGIDHSTLYTSKSKVIGEAQAYVWGAERMERDSQEHTHVITVRTATTGKIVFDETVTVPAKPVAPQTAVQTPCEGRPGSYGGCAMDTDGIRGVPAPATVMIDGHHHCQAHARMASRLISPDPSMITVGLDMATLNTDNTILCGWCDYSADRKIQILGQSHAEYACASHFREYYPYLSNPQMESALCPDVAKGCSHTMAQNEQGWGVACVEFADARGIQWRYA